MFVTLISLYYHSDHFTLLLKKNTPSHFFQLEALFSAFEIFYTISLAWNYASAYMCSIVEWKLTESDGK